MKTRYRIYGDIKGEGQENSSELSNVYLCFRDVSEAKSFAKFLGECIAEMEVGPGWDHEHFFPNTEGHADIIVSLLYESNY